MDLTDEEKTKLRLAIEVLRQRLVVRLADVEATKATIAQLYNELGEPLPSFEEITGNNAAGSQSSHSKSVYRDMKLATAAKLYLKLRHTPSTVRDIFDALRAGGFRFAEQTGQKKKEDQIGVLRTSLRRNTRAFIRVSNDNYGLRSWYPEAKRKLPHGSHSSPSAA